MSLFMENKNRIKNTIENICYEDTLDFFNKRAEKFNEKCPYSVTMYQDKKPELVIERNQFEVDKIKPLLELNKQSRILDIACGIGRWSDAITDIIDYYCGIDFSKELIEIARKRNEQNTNREFFVGASNETKRIVDDNNLGKFNIVILAGIFIYLNENELIDTLDQIQAVTDEHAIIYIREPVGLDNRLTLKNYYSQELDDNYNAIYRTRDELQTVFEKTIFKYGYSISNEGFVFEDEELNNRKETSQYYYIIKK